MFPKDINTLDPAVFIYIILAFLSGALPLALWIGRIAGVDLRKIGDGNPGATNVFRGAGPVWGVTALMADIGKAVIPVGIAYQLWNWHGYPMLLVAIAPSLGHAFSPFLKGRGGKALATMLGAWIGLTWVEMPAVLLISLILFFLFVKPDGWVVLFTSITGLVYLLLFKQVNLYIGLKLLQMGLLILTHRADLIRFPRLTWPGSADNNEPPERTGAAGEPHIPLSEFEQGEVGDEALEN